jgi:hypothetical protein
VKLIVVIVVTEFALQLSVKVVVVALRIVVVVLVMIIIVVIPVKLVAGHLVLARVMIIGAIHQKLNQSVIVAVALGIIVHQAHVVLKVLVMAILIMVMNVMPTINSLLLTRSAFNGLAYRVKYYYR